MIAYRGNLKFTKASLLAQGAKKILMKAITKETVDITEVTGTGTLYLADKSKRVMILDLGERDSISVNGNDILAFESSVSW
jgi:uncharacterized protein (AIM24 family)